MKIKFDGQTLRIARRAVGMSQARLAKEVGINPATVSHYETGLRSMDDDIAKQLRAALPISDEDLMFLLAAHRQLKRRKGRAG